MKPINTIRDRNISIAIWDNGKFMNYTVSKGYKDTTGSWHNQKLMCTESELDSLVKLIDEVKKLKIEGSTNNEK